VSRVRGRARSVGVVSRLVVGVPWWCSHQGSRGSEGVVLAGSAAEACIRAGGAHDGIVGHGQVGLNQLVDRVVGHADRRARSLVVSEPHAASACVRHRISPSRKP